MMILSKKVVAIKPVTIDQGGPVTASITEITRGTHASGDLPIVVDFDVTQVPSGTIALNLVFITDQEWPQSANSWEGPKTYGFPANIWSGHEAVIGKPAGVAITIKFALIAMDEDGEVLERFEGDFKLNRVTWE